MSSMPPFAAIFRFSDIALTLSPRILAAAGLLTALKPAVYIFKQHARERVVVPLALSLSPTPTRAPFPVPSASPTTPYTASGNASLLLLILATLIVVVALIPVLIPLHIDFDGDNDNRPPPPPPPRPNKPWWDDLLPTGEPDSNGEDENEDDDDDDEEEDPPPPPPPSPPTDVYEPEQPVTSSLWFIFLFLFILAWASCKFIRVMRVVLASLSSFLPRSNKALKASTPLTGPILHTIPMVHELVEIIPTANVNVTESLASYEVFPFLFNALPSEPSPPPLSLELAWVDIARGVLNDTSSFLDSPSKFFTSSSPASFVFSFNSLLLLSTAVILYFIWKPLMSAFTKLPEILRINFIPDMLTPINSCASSFSWSTVMNITVIILFAAIRGQIDSPYICSKGSPAHKLMLFLDELNLEIVFGVLTTTFVAWFKQRRSPSSSDMRRKNTQVGKKAKKADRKRKTTPPLEHDAADASCPTSPGPDTPPPVNDTQAPEGTIQPENTLITVYYHRISKEAIIID